MRAWKPLEADGGGGLDEDAFETEKAIAWNNLFHCNVTDRGHVNNDTREHTEHSDDNKDIIHTRC